MSPAIRPAPATRPGWRTHAPASQHARVVERVLAAGATLLGKVITDELAFSLHGDNLHYGTPVNSAAPDSVPGGSSSGSAAAVAARLVDFALATDTGGSTPGAGQLLRPLGPAHHAGAGLDARPGAARTGLRHRDLAGSRCRHLRSRRRGVAARVAAGAAPADRSRRCLRARRPGVRRAAARRRSRALGRLASRAAPRTRQRRLVAGSLAQRLRDAGAVAELARPRRLDRPRAAALRSGDRGPLAGRAGDQRGRADQASRAAAEISARVRELLGADGIAVLPSAASVAPRRDAEASAVDAVPPADDGDHLHRRTGGLAASEHPFRRATRTSLPVGVSCSGRRAAIGR